MDTLIGALTVLVVAALAVSPVVAVAWIDGHLGNVLTPAATAATAGEA